MKHILAITTLLFAAFSAPVFAADAPKAAPAAAKPAAAAAKQIDINTANKKELMKLDGIGDARADGIIKGRPYGGKDELVDKKIVPQDVYDKIKEQIIAKQKKK